MDLSHIANQTIDITTTPIDIHMDNNSLYIINQTIKNKQRKQRQHRSSKSQMSPVVRSGPI